ncbi:MAG: hypothetical protein GYB18_08345 [Oceanospirillales bacterium]|nr:hypothetical protein [Oceanospirillales bacterium]
MAYQQLKTKHRALRESFHQNLSLRTHRALSWLDKAEQSVEDLDIQFISLWIAFNAAYATDIDAQYRTTERGMFESFFEKLLELDNENHLYNLVWAEFSSTIRLLLNNQFIFQPFWDYQNGIIAEEDWKADFNNSKKRAAQGLGNKNTPLVLSVVFRRVYTLRNQIIHGGATWNIDLPQ